jgi:hypothetical protein
MAEAKNGAAHSITMDSQLVAPLATRIPMPKATIQPTASVGHVPTWTGQAGGVAGGKGSKSNG